MKDEMDTSMYKEFSYKVKGFKVVSFIIASVALVLCMLIGIGTWVLVSGVRENEQFLTDVREQDITIIEGEIREPLKLGEKSINNVDKVIQHIAEIDFTEGTPKHIDEADLIPAGNVYKYEEPSREMTLPKREFESNPQNSNGFSRRFLLTPEKTENIDNTNVESARQIQNIPIIEKIIKITTNLRDDIFENPIFTNSGMENTFRSLFDNAQQLLGHQEPATHRSERSIAPMMIGNALKYASYLSFAGFMYKEASAITEYKIESRKLHNDPEANFLDNIFWAKPSMSNKPSRIDVVDPSEQTAIEASEDKPFLYGSDNWTPMVNQVSLGFMSELLNTLLKIMREFLLRDHVMECLWYMFCQDVNHQAKYSDVYGVMARVNSVGLKVLTDREGRETDTIGEIWKAISAYAPLQCDVMFPKCDGSKALEIVNDVASGSE